MWHEGETKQNLTDVSASHHRKNSMTENMRGRWKSEVTKRSSKKTEGQKPQPHAHQEVRRSQRQRNPQVEAKLEEQKLRETAFGRDQNDRLLAEDQTRSSASYGMKHTLARCMRSDHLLLTCEKRCCDVWLRDGSHQRGTLGFSKAQCSPNFG